MYTIIAPTHGTMRIHGTTFAAVCDTAVFMADAEPGQTVYVRSHATGTLYAVDCHGDITERWGE